jgi:hypothetical protein
MDVERFEINVLKGMAKLIEQFQPVIVAELGQGGDRGGDYEAQIRSLLPGYEILRVRRPFSKAVLFAESGYSLYTVDFFRGFNYVAFPSGYLCSRLQHLPPRFKRAFRRRKQETGAT